MKTTFFLLAALLILTTGCPPRTAHDPQLDKLVETMTGTFTSAGQAEADSNYHDITLHMYPIWQGQKNFRYLYVEQAVTAMPDKPYRQRVYVLSKQIPGRFTSRIFTLPDEDRFIGKYNDPAFFDVLNTDSLIEREGCIVHLETQKDGTWIGSTTDYQCKSNLRGASYATSEVEILEDRIISWDQGWDSTGVQVWGTIDGGYVFERASR